MTQVMVCKKNKHRSIFEHSRIIGEREEKSSNVQNDCYQ